MLILRRKTGESLVVNGDIRITVAESSSDGVRLAIEAPKDVRILREELIEAGKANREAAASASRKNGKMVKGLLDVGRQQAGKQKE